MRPHSAVPQTMSRPRPPLWLHPFVSFSTIVAAGLAIFLATDDTTFGVQFQQPKADWLHTLGYYLYVWLSVSLGIAAGELFPRRLTPGRTLPAPSTFDPYLRNLGFAALCLSIMAFALWFTLAGSPVSLIAAVFGGESGTVYDTRDTFRDSRLPGLTSLFNLAPWWFAYVGYRRYVLGRRLTAFQKGATLAVLFVVLIYSLAVSERRQLVTLFVPAAVVMLMLGLPARRWWVTWLPLIAVAGLMVLFLVGEYFRSWVNFYVATGEDYVPWALTRMGGYFSTSINNGVNYVDFAPRTGGWLTFEGFLKMPGVSNLVGSFDDTIGDQLGAILSAYGNPEFNNPGGMIVPLIDFGLPLGGMVLCVIGVIVGHAWRKAQCGEIFWILVYTQLYFALIEGTRVMYATSSTAVTNLLFLTLFSFVAHRPMLSPPYLFGARGPAAHGRIGAGFTVDEPFNRQDRRRTNDADG